MTSRLSAVKRLLEIDFGESQCILLLGPRKTGKTTLLKKKFPHAQYIDLLKSDVRSRFLIRPSELREVVQLAPHKVYIVDEIQKVPELMDEVHWLIENTRAKFILCGSSARKLKRGAANLLGGRALKLELFPLVCRELKDFKLERAINHGLLPQHYLSQQPQRFLRAYVDLYLQEEIVEESQIRKLQSFYRFLEVAALMNGELLNYANVGADCGVSGKTVREYYQILEDTLLGFTLEPWRKAKNRKLIETSKFYLFDAGVIRYLKGIENVSPKTIEFGNLFETFLVNEVRAYLSYKQSQIKMSFWKATSGQEVDLILGNMKIAVEFKSATSIQNNDLRGLKALMEEHHPEKCFLVCQETVARKMPSGIVVLPYTEFLDQLWSGLLV